MICKQNERLCVHHFVTDVSHEFVSTYVFAIRYYLRISSDGIQTLQLKQDR